MSDLKTTYLGLDLRSPLVVAACSVSSYIDRIKQAEEAGAGAIVIRSLFEEQIMADSLAHEEDLNVGAEAFAEATSYFPTVDHGGAAEHLSWIEKTRQGVDMPIIGSLNAMSKGSWTSYAKQLADAGCDAIELNLYVVPADITQTGADLEAEQVDIVESVVQSVKVPVSVKLSPFYTSPGNFAKKLVDRKVAGLVLFNRFLQPDIDPDVQDLSSEMPLSGPEEQRLPLRWTALLAGRLKADLSLTTGVHSGRDVAKALLAGATTVQIASALIKNGIPFLSSMLWQFQQWMDEQGYTAISDLRGKLSSVQVEDPFAYERAHYVKLLQAQK